MRLLGGNMLKKFTYIFILFIFFLDCSKKDTTPPIVEILEPENNSYVSGIVKISVKAYDNVKVNTLQIFIDGNKVSSSSDDTCTYLWNTYPLEINSSHTILAKATDESGNEGSEMITVYISDIHVPAKPYKPIGPTNGEKNINYSFSTFSFDPDSDSVCLRFSWGDGDTSSWSSYVASGDTVNMVHFWSEKGTYIVKAQAKDIKGIKSQWSEGAEIKIEEQYIVFYSYRNQNYDIFVITSDGSYEKNLTNNLYYDECDPSWSSDRKKIVFTSIKDGNGEIYIMDADGSNRLKLTNNVFMDYEPSFSPDGQKIVFSSWRDGNSEIYIMNVDGSNQSRLTYNSASDYDPCWSPDGSKILFTSNITGNWEIYIMNADGSNLLNLTNNPYNDFDPCFSPDGSKILFSSNRDGDGEIYIMNANGSNVIKLTNNSFDDAEPSFSPDGSKIVFTSNRDGDVDIYIMNLDGSNQTNITDNIYDDFDPNFR